jgi:predicted cupin superfamily sugar epimerase
MVQDLIASNNVRFPTIEQVVEKLKLKLYPGGSSGYYEEIYKASEYIDKRNLSADFKAEKYSLSSSIFYLLPENNILKFHSTVANKQFHHYLGSALQIFIIHMNGTLEKVILGKDILANQVLHLKIPANTYVAAQVYPSKVPMHSLQYSLIGCTTSPSWEIEDCTRVTTQELIKQFPQHTEVIRQFT